MSVLERLANPCDPTSLSNRFRSRRFRHFERFTESFARPFSILDVGGTVSFLEHRGWAGRADVQITLVNLEAEDQKHDNIRSCVASATDVSEFPDQSFDVTFSNSVIEHLFTLDAQVDMAREVRRVGRTHWVQTPNYWFPIEPHLHFPGWQWLPMSMRVAVIRRIKCGHRWPCRDRKLARELVSEIRLMTRTELSRLFPDSTIWPERVLGLVKSWVVYGGPLHRAAGGGS